MTPAEVVANAEAVILDFDGPMCDVFATYPASKVAQELAAFTEGVWSQHGDSLDELLLDTDDPFEILRTATNESVPRAAHVSTRLRELEMKAVEGAPATAGLLDLLSQLHGSGQAVAVASNNSTAAVIRWLGLQGLEYQFAHVSGRQTRSDQLKPDPFVLQEVCSILDLGPMDCVFIGDSQSDLEAADAISMPFIGFANKPDKHRTFRQHGCTFCIASLTELLPRALRLPGRTTDE